MAFTQITVTGRRQLGDGTAASGSITFTPAAPLRNSTATAETTIRAPFHGTITAGVISASVAATTDPGTLPTGGTYVVEERYTGVSAIRRYHLRVPHDSPGGILDLDTTDQILETLPDAVSYPATGPAGPPPTLTVGTVTTGTPSAFELTQTSPGVYEVDVTLQQGVTGAGSVDSVNGDPGPNIVITQADLTGLVNAKDYGALGDGTTNDYTAILAAVTAVKARGGGAVWFPAGIYAITQKLIVPPNVFLVAESAYAATLKLTAGSAIAIFLEFGAAATINVFGGLKNIQVDANAKAQTGVKMFGPQEGACISESFVHGATVTAVDAVGTGILGGTNMFEIGRSWIWTTGNAGMAGLTISGGLAKITGSTFVGTNRTVDPPAGSAGIVATDASIVIDCVNSEHWEVGYSLTRTYAELRSPETAECDYGVRTSADSNFPVILSGNPGWNNAVANLDDDGDCIQITGETVTPKAVRAYASATSQTIASGVQDVIDLSATEFNTGGGFTVDLTANTITCLDTTPALLVYEVSYSGGGGAGSRYAAVQSSLQGQIRIAGTGGVGEYTATGTAVIQLSAGEVLHLEGYVDGGSPVGVRSDGVAFTGLSLAQL